MIWSKFAESQLDEIFDFYKTKTKSYPIAKKIISNILIAPEVLKKNPSIGQKEINLKSRRFKYRYLIESHYKIIYSVDKESFQIRIADVFDTRQSPTKLKRNK